MLNTLAINQWLDYTPIYVKSSTTAGAMVYIVCMYALFCHRIIAGV